MYGVLQGAEVAARNAMHNSMAGGLNHVDWYEYVAWDTPELQSLERAKESLLRRRKALAPGRVVAELTFGFWVQLTAAKYEKFLWVPYLHKAFPGITTNRKGLNRRLHQILDLRNRVAHHERILHFDLLAKYSQILETVRWACPVTAEWIESTNRARDQFIV